MNIDFHGAISDFTKVIEADPKSYEAYYNRGFTKYTVEDYNGAINDFNLSIKIHSNNPRAFNDRGNAKFQLGDKKGACLDWQNSKKLGFSEADNKLKEYCNQ